MTGSRRSLFVLGLLIASSAVAYSCAGSSPPAPVASLPPPKVTRSPSPAGAPSTAPAEPLSLEGFRPLLADARYAAARIKHEAGDYSAAADLVRAALGSSPPPAGEQARHRFLLARLLENAGRTAEARDAFDTVDRSSALAAYAELGGGRMELRLGFADRALAHVGRVPETLPKAAGRSRLLADAALKSGAREIALREYRTLLEQARGDDERADAARALLDALETGRVTAGTPTGPGVAAAAEVAEALRLVRLLSALNSGPGTAKWAQAATARWLERAPEAEREGLAMPTSAEQLENVRRLVEARRFEPAAALLAPVPPLDAAASEPEACELELLRAKVWAGTKQSADAERSYLALAHSHCHDDKRARALFAAGRTAQSGGRHAVAVKLFAEVERSFPAQSVADDARLYGALASLELGDEARFTDALSSMPDDYPDGDMLAEGCFRLALRRMEKRDYPAAARPLLRAIERLPALENGRGGDFAGRERYFLARVQQETGEREQALSAYEQLISDVPLGYYVRAAYTALAAADTSRAARALERSAEQARREPPSMRRPPGPLEPGFQRALELASVGELDWVSAELSALSADASTPELLYNAAVLYARAGAIKLSSDAARSVMGKVPPRFPAGDWLPAWKLAYPKPYADVVSEQAKKNAVAPSLIYAVMREESAFDPEAESPADAYGLMQLILPTARQMAKPLGLPHDRVALKRPSINISLGARVLASYRDKFPADPLLAIAAYNAGPGAAQRWRKQRSGESFDLWVELIPYVETRRYIKRVLGSAAVYALIYDEAAPEQAIGLPHAVSG